MGADAADAAVVLVTGVMAAGKSTVAELLASRLPRAAHVRGDVFRRMVVSGREEMTPEPASGALAQLDLRQRIAATVADEYAGAGFTAVVQDILLGDDLPRFVARVRTRPLYVVVLAPSAEAVREREAGRAKTGYSGGWAVDGFVRALREETPRIGLWLDTSGQTPHETVDAILAGLARAEVPEAGAGSTGGPSA
ncbi:AAA family ATPase [Streptomyces abyssomicinicus]|uniref:AAA family ATPase n=1 Tax=Streptomyces abyssomicinicus TaxID=574929 RepID=UPI00125099E1|nr:AAA family ATPase [Streptomyces abyssomicinicus]